MAVDQHLRRGVPVWLLLAALAGLALAFVAGPRLFRRWGHRPRPPGAVCLSNVKNMTLAVQMYLSDYDGVFPPAAEWCDTMLESVRNEDVYRCPEAWELRSGQAYNTALSTVRSDTVARAGRTIVLFESDRGWNAAGGRELLPEEPRHLDGDNYAFADGSAKWVSREEAISGEAGLRWEP